MAMLETDRLARRNAILLALAAGIGGGNAAINIALGGIVGGLLAPDRSLATLPITAFVLGSFLTAMPASLLMAKVGRKVGFLLGGAIGVSGGLIAAAGVMSASFPLFMAGTLLAGSYHGFAQFYRFAATDGASPAFRPKAVSYVLVGGLASAVVGPQMIIHTKESVPGILFAGPFIGAAVLIALAMIFVVTTRFPDISEAGASGPPPRPLGAIARQPAFVGAVVTGMISYALMNLVMTASPLAMIACGHSVDTAALGIQWHIIAMYAPGFFTGALIARFGVDKVMITGLALLAGCGVVALAGISVAHFWAALILLGVGWNFAYVGATTLVASAHTPAERGKVQGLNDSLVFGLVALASLTAGWLQSSRGWEAVLLVIFPAVAVALVATVMASRRRLRATPA
jgi:predicted MFS family arabinose efflux permease